VKKEVRGAAGETTAQTATRDTAAAKKTFTDEEKRVCSIEAMKNGEECEACQ
jgi:ribonucleoside-diphosphate reductase alpha chain